MALCCFVTRVDLIAGLSRPFSFPEQNFFLQCFGQELKADFGAAIAHFSRDFRELEKDPPLKVHILEAHVVQFLERQKDEFPGKGLGWFSEQASESVHHDWDELWIGNKYKRQIGDDDYDSQLKKCGVTYNSRHM